MYAFHIARDTPGYTTGRLSLVSASLKEAKMPYAGREIAEVDVRFLGSFQLICDHVQVTNLIQPRLQSFLSYLILHSNAPQSRMQLAYQIWPDSSDGQALTNLRTLLSRLRSTLPDLANWLHVERQWIQWRPDVPWVLDVFEFEQAARQVKQSQDLRARTLALEAMIDLYPGDLLPGSYDEWVMAERDRLRQLYLSALQQLISVQEQQRNYSGAIGAAQLLVRQDPLNEEAYCSLMRLHAQCGNRAAALRVYKNCLTVLRNELEAMPSESTRRLYEQLFS
jgi:DNA-binding SARP family transcriptional activator